MLIRPYERNDAEAIVTLFYESVRTVAAADYTPEQLAACAQDKGTPYLITRSGMAPSGPAN